MTDADGTDGKAERKMQKTNAMATLREAYKHVICACLWVVIFVLRLRNETFKRLPLWAQATIKWRRRGRKAPAASRDVLILGGRRSPGVVRITGRDLNLDGDRPEERK